MDEAASGAAGGDDGAVAMLEHKTRRGDVNSWRQLQDYSRLQAQQWARRSADRQLERLSFSSFLCCVIIQGKFPRSLWQPIPVRMPAAVFDTDTADVIASMFDNVAKCMADNAALLRQTAGRRAESFRG